MTFLFDQDVPEDLTYLLRELDHGVLRVRNVLGPEATDPAVLQCAFDGGHLLVTCNRDDFIALADRQPHHGIIVVIRRRTRAQERAAFVRLLERAGEAGLRENINFA